MNQDIWTQIKNEVRSSVGANNYTAWIEPLTYKSLDGRVIQLEAPTPFIGNWVAQNFSDIILRHLANAGVPVERLECIVTNRLTNTVHHSEKTNKAFPRQLQNHPSEDADITGATLDPRFTFSEFVVGTSNEMAFTAAQRVALGETLGFNPLFLYGGVGLGKTHLMQAIAWQVKAQKPHKRVLYLSAEQFMYRFIQALRQRDTMTFKQLFRTVDILLVDDVQFIAGKQSTQEEFFHTFNALIDQGKQIVISSDRSPGDMADVEERIKSRLQSGLVVDLHPANYELRLGILQQKATHLKDKNSDLVIAPGVLEFLAERISSNIRVLEGAITRLFAFSSLVGGTITLERATDCLADVLRSSERKLTIEEIMKKVCEYYGIRMSDLVSARRTRSVARPRQMAMYLAKSLTPRSYPEIGHKFGGRDHTTILHGVRKIEQLIAIDTQIAEDAQILQRKLEG